MATDIIARLRLAGDSFSSDQQKIWSELENRAKQAGSTIRSTIGGALGEIGASAKQALSGANIDTRNIDLGSAAIQKRADAAMREAQVLREVADASARAAAAQDHATDEVLAYAAASATLARSAEENAQQLTREVIALDAIQAELAKSTTAVRIFDAEHDKSVKTSKASAAGMQQLGFQLGDAVTMWSLNAKPMQIFSSQASQVVGALSLMSGEAKGLLGFLGGPWGQVLTAAAIVVGTLYTEVDKTSDAMEKGVKAADSFGTAQSMLGKIIDLNTGKMKTHNAVLIQMVRLQAQSALLAGQKAEKDARDTIGNITKPGIVDSVGDAFKGLGRAFTSGGVGGYESGKDVARERYGQNVPLNTLTQSILSGQVSDPAAISKEVDRLNSLGLLAGKTAEQIIELKQQLLTLPQAKNDQLGAQQVIDAIDGKGIAPDLVPYSKDKKPKKPKDNSRAIIAAENAGARDMDRIGEISSQFAGDPTRVQQVNKALNDLDAIIRDINTRKIKPQGFEDIIAAAEKAKVVVQESINKPFTDLVRSANERQQVDQLILRGQYDQATALQQQLALEKQMPPLTAAQKAQLLDIVKAEEARARAIEDQRRKMAVLTSAVGDVRSSFEDLLMGGGVADFGKALVNDFKKLQVRIVSEQLFGGLERQIEDMVTGRSGMKAATDYLTEQADGAGKSLFGFVTAAQDATARMNSVAAPTAASNDNFGGGTSSIIGGAAIPVTIDQDELYDAFSDANGVIAKQLGLVAEGQQDIVVTARQGIVKGDQQSKQVIGALETFSGIFGGVFKNLDNLLGIKLPSELKSSLSTVIQGYVYGQIGNSITGNKSSASEIGSTVGAIVGKEVLGKTIGQGLSAISSKLGSLGGPIGSIVGAVAGSLLGGLIKGKPMLGSTVITSATASDPGAWGRQGGLENVNAVGKSVQSSLSQMATQLNATLGQFAVSIGNVEYNGQSVYRVSGDPNYSLGTQDYYNNGGTTLYDGTDATAAMKAAVINAIQDGALKGISEASKRILTSGQDLDTALQQALSLESIPKELKKLKDPLGAAIDDLDARFAKMKQTIADAGGDAELSAEAQELYNLQLKQLKEQMGGASDTLKNFLNSLNVGSSSPLSLRDQEAAAKEALQPYLTSINAGESIDQDKYTAAAKDFLDIERALYGSTSKYFEAFNAIQAVTNKAISTVDNATPIATVSDANIAATASAAASTAASTANMETLMQQNNVLMQKLVEFLGADAANNFLAQAAGY